MSTFGCHSCGTDLSKYKDTPWEQTPCASCPLNKEYNNTCRVLLFDSASSLDEDESLGIYDEHYEDPLLDLEHAVVNDMAGLKELEAVIRNRVMVVQSNIIIKLVKLAKTNPTMFEIVIKKMQFPHMSYSEIGESMTPKCGKQTVLYHLKRAVELFPDLEAGLLTDTRFSGGRYALQTVANRKRKVEAEKRLEGLIYGDDSDNPMHKAMSLRELNSILSAKFMVDDEVLDFNPYIKDEDQI